MGAVILWVAPANSYLGLIISLAMTGKFFISGTFALAYLYTAELFPTPVRSVAVGGASTFARIGSASAPYIVDILGGISAQALRARLFARRASAFTQRTPRVVWAPQ